MHFAQEHQDRQTRYFRTNGKPVRLSDLRPGDVFIRGTQEFEVLTPPRTKDLVTYLEAVEV